MPTRLYSTEALLRAMAPIDIVIDSFHSAQCNNAVENETQPPLKSPWSEKSQGRFASLIVSIAKTNNKTKYNNHSNDDTHDNNTDDWSTISFLPSHRYVHKLIQRYTSRLQHEGEGAELENDRLASLVCYFSISSKKMSTSTSGVFHSSVPDPLASCIVSFHVPIIAPGDDRKKNKFARQIEPFRDDDDNGDDDLLRIRVYPHHNDVGVAKVWEAGACLAEYILCHPEVVRGRKIVELGAGVGLTGLVAAAAAAAASASCSSSNFSGGRGNDGGNVVGGGDLFVHMTDYTEACLENMACNVELNEGWLRRRGVDPVNVTVVSIFEWCCFYYFVECLVRCVNYFFVL